MLFMQQSPTTHIANQLENGLAVIHANQLESLLEVAGFWANQYPLSPLENELFLVSNNGMAQWLKQQLALQDKHGIAAALDIKLPSTFIWSVYRQVLGTKIPKHQILAKAPLTWRLYRLLPDLIKQAEFTDLARFLADDQGCRKRYQLAEKLADLFDQYQVYRADWLVDWASGDDLLTDALGQKQPLPAAQHWQACLWRALVADLGAVDLSVASRASVHAEFLKHIDTAAVSLPRRVMVFGISSLPQQFIEVLAKLARCSQVILFVHNPCQYYWADIIEDRLLLKAERRRQDYKKPQLAQLDPEQLHQHANPLLAAWGKQGRDYIRLLDQFDEQSAYRHWHWPANKVDLFQDYGADGQRTLLQQLQQGILNLEPLPQSPLVLDAQDGSLQFHIAHSRQREVEILHDQLLALFNAEHHDQPLQPRDVIVMVPDINSYAPHIRAVFGQIARDDRRFIPFSLADQQQRGHNPLLNALETLLKLPESRFAVSECLSLLEVPALRKRFAIDEAALPRIKHWIAASGVRWGLNPEQRRHRVSMPEDLQANTWEFGLQRMLLGYAVGDGVAFQTIAPFAEIAGLDAQYLGSLAALLAQLQHYAAQLAGEYHLQQWQTLLRELLVGFFEAGEESERKTLERLEQGLQQWQQHGQLAGLDNSQLLPVTVVREVWLTAVDEPHLQQRFLSGRVNFCTLMPMRAIPFRVVCLLGMNDGDYPRSQQPAGFDLMAQAGQYRPGDRSRRQDDQYLFLEALLSARQQLYISWVGRSIRDNSSLPPSVLVSQLRDAISQGWQIKTPPAEGIMAALTVEHPLQAFSEQYIRADRDPRLFTYAREWFAAAPQVLVSDRPVSAVEPAQQLSLEGLAAFLKAPVKTFCQQTLKFSFQSDQLVDLDHEPFELDGLQRFLLKQQLLESLKNTRPDDLELFFTKHYQRLQAQGQLAMADFGRLQFQQISNELAASWQHYQALLASWPEAQPAQALQLTLESCQLNGALLDLYRNRQGDLAQLMVSAESLLDKKISGPKHQPLLLPWLQHLLAAASGISMQTLIAGHDSCLRLAAVEPAAAQAQLRQLLAGWRQGLQQPLPVAIRTALVWLAHDPAQRDSKARQRYQGSALLAGEADYDAYLRRFYPLFDDLQLDAEQGFGYWAAQLYGELSKQLQAVEQVI